MKRTALVAAMALALGVAGCTGGSGAGRDDAAITMDVKTALIDSGVPGSIDVTTKNGVVTLSGTVPDAQTKSRAGEIADKSTAATGVVNNLRATMAGDAPARIPPLPQAPVPGAGAIPPAAPELR